MVDDGGRARAQPPLGRFSDFIFVLYLYAMISTTEQAPEHALFIFQGRSRSMSKNPRYLLGGAK
jgi:hypothetical protein